MVCACYFMCIIKEWMGWLKINVDDTKGGSQQWCGGTALRSMVGLKVGTQSMVSGRFVSIVDLYIYLGKQ
jgi:hypothetical protein